MIKSIIVVVVLLAGLCYSAFFLTWNSETKVDLVTLRAGGDPFWIQAVPVGFLPLAGLVIGALIMAVAAIGPWAAQRRAAKLAEAKLAKAVEKFNEQKGRLSARAEEIARLEARIAELECAPAAAATPANQPAVPDAPAVADVDEAVA